LCSLDTTLLPIIRFKLAITVSECIQTLWIFLWLNNLNMTSCVA